MRNLACGIAVCALLSAVNASAQNKSQVGTWKLDAAQSELGSEPAPKSVTVTILKDTPEMLSWRVSVVDADGKAATYSWSGPADGSMHPAYENGKAGAVRESCKKDAQGVVIRHGEIPDGSTFDARGTMSEDGNTLTDEITSKSKDGKETKQKYVYHRVTGTAKSTEKKPAA